MNKKALSVAILLLFGVSSLWSQEAEKKAEKPKLPKNEQALFQFLNKEREKEKVPLLTLNAKLCLAAKNHAENMAKQEKMAHKLDEKNAKDRVLAVGYQYTSVGENLAYASAVETNEPPAPKDIHERWMKSKGHRENILKEKFREVGIAMVKSAKGNYYYAQVFGTHE